MRDQLTDARIRAAKAAAKPYKLADGAGLVLLITPQGKKLWRLRFRLGGTESMYAIGQYPGVALKQAREAAAQAKRLISDGRNPSQHRVEKIAETIKKSAHTFEAVAKEWICAGAKKWSTTYLNQVRTVLTTDVFPSVGRIPIESVTAHHLLLILRSVEERGAETVAILIRQWCSAIFRYAIATLRASSDPAAALRGAISRPRVKHKQALNENQIAEMFGAIRSNQGTHEVRSALHLLLLTFVRPGELRNALWSEIDFDRAVWRIPAERMKMGNAHVVPLSSQAMEVLAELRSRSIGRPQIFPNVRDPKRVMSPTTLNRFLERSGFQGKFSAHGFRATASTLLNEKGYRSEVIERQLAHAERNKVRASYNHASYMVDRQSMMQEWANLLDSIDGTCRQDDG